MAEPVTITLGGRSFPLGKLTLGKLVEIAEILDSGAEDQSLKASIERSAKMLAIALRDAGLSEDQVMELGGDLDELRTGVNTIMQLAGFKMGEARPVAGSSPSNSPISTAPSPPAADTASPTSIN
jgi:hypothetical protein